MLHIGNRYVLKTAILAIIASISRISLSIVYTSTVNSFVLSLNLIGEFKPHISMNVCASSSVINVIIVVVPLL